MEEAIEIRLRYDLAELARMSEAVEAFGESCGLPMKCVLELNLVLEELVVNVIHYAHEEAGDSDILLRIGREAGRVHIELIDDGKPFNPLEAKEADVEQSLEERPIGGLGLHLVRKMTDSMDYRREDGKNILRLTKQIEE